LIPENNLEICGRRGNKELGDYLLTVSGLGFLVMSSNYNFHAYRMRLSWKAYEMS
jgi:hypothetical protein